MQQDEKYDVSDVLIVFGTNIRKAREAQNRKIQTMAEDINYDRGCLTSVEYGEQNLRYETVVRLARILNVSFPALFSRNFMEKHEDETVNFAGSFQEDDFLFVFRENYKRELQAKSLKQTAVYDVAGVDRAVVNRVLNGKEKNPTLRTLAAMASTTGSEMFKLFTRTA